MLTEEGASRRHIMDHQSTVELKEYGENTELEQNFVDRIKRDGLEAWQTYYGA